MTTKKSEEKTALLLSPQRLEKDHIILELLRVSKSFGSIKYHVEQLDKLGMIFLEGNIPVNAKEILKQFTEAAIVETKEQSRKKFLNKKAGISFDRYQKNAMIRKLHELVESIKPFASLFSWYHKLEQQKGYFRTEPCRFNPFRPTLSFEVVNEDGLKLQTFVTLNGSNFPLKTFNRYLFLLESRNEYFVLSLKEFHTLEWLDENDPVAYSHQPMEFARDILSRLETDYPVNRNNLFTKNEITAEPQHRVLLSEISRAFLVLTPQWTYDGFLVEGPWKESSERAQHGEIFVIRRNKEKESEFISLIESLHPNFCKQLNGYYYLSFAEAQKKQWFLKVYHKLLGLNIQLAGMDMLEHFRFSPHQVTADITITERDEEMITLKMKVSFGTEEIPLSELQKRLLADQRSLLLKDGSLGILNEEWVKQYGTLIRHGKISNNEIRIHKWLALEQGDEEKNNVLKPALNNTWWLKWKTWQETDEEVYALPSSVDATLRPYQKKGFEWMALLAETGAGACLADDMGLGKTLQTICFLAYQLKRQPGIRHLIICPSSLIYNWQAELTKFAPGISTLVYYGPARSISDIENGDHQVVITSYGAVRSDIDKMSAIFFSVIVLDESHHIKNPGAQITQALGQLRSATRLALSGTPVMNNTFDLYAQLNFLLPGLFGHREFFKREYADPIDRDHDPVKTVALRRLTAPFILRRTKEQVAKDLPAKTEMIMWCKMKPAQKMLYEEIKNSIRDSLFLNIKNQGLNKNKLAILQGMMKLRQLCSSPLLLPEEERSCSDSVKTELLMDELSSNLKDHKVLVFSQFAGMLHLLAENCKTAGIAFYHFDGQTPAAKRAEMVNLFQEEGNPVNVFLISLKAGNAGLNLTAADYVFLFDPWWNTAVQQQAIDRTHRIGQTKNVFAYKMICKDTIEEKITEIQKRKKQLAEDLITEEDGFVKNLSEEDVEYLFS